MQCPWVRARLYIRKYMSSVMPVKVHTAYLRVIPEDGECTVTLITSKSRVAPLKKVTLPRLE